MTRNQTIDLIAFLISAYPTQRARLSAEDVEAMVASWSTLLADLDFAIVKQAVARVARISKFIPSVAEIREAIGDVTGGFGNRRTGLEAWSEVMRKVGSKGPHNIPGKTFNFDDPITAQIMTPELWNELLRSDNITSERARFVEAYQLAQARERREVQASNGAVSKALPAPAREAVAQLEGMASDLASKLGGQRG